MSGYKHTPGPWRIRAERHRFIHVYASGGGIAHLDTIDGEGAANARLIAAAPELLEALKLLCDHCRLYHSEVEGNNVGEQVRSVIAKATGNK